MDAGDVELSGAVDFNPNSVGDKPNTQGIEDAKESVETANEVASVKEEDIRFRSDKIRNSSDDMFVRVEGGERRKREALRREERERKESLREAKMASRRENEASKQVADSEKQLKNEQHRIVKEQRQQKRRARRQKIFAWIKKHWYIFAAIVVIAAIVAGVMLVSKMIADAQEKQVAAEKEQFIQENKTDVQRVFVEVAGEELTKEKIDKVVEKYNGTVAVEYYAQAVSIHAKDSYLESVISPLATNTKSYGGFYYSNYIGSDNVFIYKRENGYEYYHKGSQAFESFDDALEAYLDEKAEGARR